MSSIPTHSAAAALAATTLHTRSGRTFHNPTRQQLHAAVDDMRVADKKPGTAWLANHTGHTLALHSDGRMVLTDASQKDWMYELRLTTLSRAVGLWMALLDADLDSLLAEPWELQRADALPTHAATTSPPPV